MLEERADGPRSLGDNSVESGGKWKVEAVDVVVGLDACYACVDCASAEADFLATGYIIVGLRTAMRGHVA